MHGFLISAFSAFPTPRLANSGDGAHVALWQIVNLLGCPIFALMLLPAVIDDFKSWIRWRREQPG